MSPLQPHEQSSPLLRLPAETRLHIYSYLVPNSRLAIDLCTPHQALSSPYTRCKTSFQQNRDRIYSPPASNLLNQVINLNSISQTNALNLLSVCTLTRSEILPALSNVIVRFHCTRCFVSFLPNCSHGLGVGIDWMRKVEVIVDTTKTNQVGWGRLAVASSCGFSDEGRAAQAAGMRGFNLEIARTMAREAMQTCQRSGWRYYGRLDLVRREKWRYEALRGGVEGENEVAEGGLVREYQAQMQMLGAVGRRQSDEVPRIWLVSGELHI